MLKSDDLLASYIHKTVQRRRPKSDLRFLTSQSLFSSHAIDPGTNLLLRTISSRVERAFGRCLDMGCGYGVIGLVLAAEGVAQQVELVDRDALAVEFTRLNAAKNQILDASSFGSLGLDDVSGSEYDLIVSNLPGKAGDTVLEHLLCSGIDRLAVEGQFWGVVVDPLWSSIEEFLSEQNVQMQHVEKGSRHVVFGFTPDADARHSASASDRGFPSAYSRGEVEFTVQKRTFNVLTMHGLPEFDGLSYSTHLFLEQLYGMRKQRFREAAVFNVTQGYVPLALQAAGMVEALHVSDRDLLALKTCQLNSEHAGFSQGESKFHHGVSWLPPGDEQYDFVGGTLRGDEPRQALEIGLREVQDRLRPGGTGVLAGASTPITRMQSQLAKSNGFRVLSREKYRGASVIVFARN